MVLTVEGMMMDSNAVQRSKTPIQSIYRLSVYQHPSLFTSDPNLVTPLGISTVFRLVQPEKVQLYMIFRFLDICTDLKLVQF